MTVGLDGTQAVWEFWEDSVRCMIYAIEDEPAIVTQMTASAWIPFEVFVLRFSLVYRAHFE